jgi:hypothetical protein
MRQCFGPLTKDFHGITVGKGRRPDCAQGSLAFRVAGSFRLRQGKSRQRKPIEQPSPMAATLESSNMEGARAALRSLIGTISVFEEAGKLYCRLGVGPIPLYRRNPAVWWHGSGGVL